MFMPYPLPKRGIHPYKVGWKTRKPRGINKGYVLPPLDDSIAKRFDPSRGEAMADQKASERHAFGVDARRADAPVAASNGFYIGGVT